MEHCFPLHWKPIKGSVRRVYHCTMQEWFVEANKGAASHSNVNEDYSLIS